jgi:predicted O-methyltransferase YrrM
MYIPDDNFLRHFKKTNGAFSVSECLALLNIIPEVPKGLYMELGTYKGKSAMVAALLLKEGEFILVEPEFENQHFAQETFDNVAPAAGDKLFLRLVGDYSTNVLPKYKSLAFLFWDSGDHGEDLVQEELKLIEDRIMQGGVLAVHDLDNQFTAIRRAYDYLLSTGKYEEIKINWAEIFNYVRSNNLENGNTSWHEKGSEEFPKFVGALKRK